VTWKGQGARRLWLRGNRHWRLVSCAAVFCSEAVELMQNWLAVLLSQLTSGYYFDPTAPGSVDAEARRYAQPVAAPD